VENYNNELHRVHINWSAPELVQSSEIYVIIDNCVPPKSGIVHDRDINVIPVSQNRSLSQFNTGKMSLSI
jgi:hypothetical protein